MVSLIRSNHMNDEEHQVSRDILYGETTKLTVENQIKHRIKTVDESPFIQNHIVTLLFIN